MTAVGLDQDDDLPEAIRFHQADVTDAAAILPALDGENGLHGFVHCAGILRHEREWQIADFDAVMQVNVSAGFALANALLPRLETAGGSIVMLASMWAIFGSAGAPAYTASKGAVAAVTRSMAVAWAPRGVRVNSVAPGWVETRMSARARGRRAIAKDIVTGRFDPQIVEIAAFEALPEALARLKAGPNPGNRVILI